MIIRMVCGECGGVVPNGELCQCDGSREKRKLIEQTVQTLAGQPLIVDEKQPSKFYDEGTLRRMTDQMNEDAVVMTLPSRMRQAVQIMPGQWYDWKENCPECHKPMTTAVTDQTANLEAVIVERMLPIDRKSWPQVYKDWLKEKRIFAAQNMWICPSCQGIWTIAGTYWTRVRINGVERMEVEQLRTAEVKVMSPREQAGEAPSPDCTLCPNCGVWREIQPYSETEVQHICPRCRCADTYPMTQGEQ